MTLDLNRLDELPRAELIALGRQYGIERPERMTRVELKDELIRVSITDAALRERSRGWLGVARDLVASVVEAGLHMPDAAKMIRGDAPVIDAVPRRPPVATVTLAEIYAAQGHTKRALKMLEQVLEKEPDHEVARHLLDQLKPRSSAPPPASRSATELSGLGTRFDLRARGGPSTLLGAPLGGEATARRLGGDTTAPRLSSTDDSSAPVANDPTQATPSSTAATDASPVRPQASDALPESHAAVASDVVSSAPETTWSSGTADTAEASSEARAAESAASTAGVPVPQSPERSQGADSAAAVGAEEWAAGREPPETGASTGAAVSPEVAGVAESVAAEVSAPDLPKTAEIAELTLNAAVEDGGVGKAESVGTPESADGAVAEPAAAPPQESAFLAAEPQVSPTHIEGEAAALEASNEIAAEDWLVTTEFDGTPLVVWQLSDISWQRMRAANSRPVIRVVATKPTWDGAERLEQELALTAASGSERIQGWAGVPFVRAALGVSQGGHFSPRLVGIAARRSEVRYRPHGVSLDFAGEVARRARAALGT